MSQVGDFFGIMTFNPFLRRKTQAFRCFRPPRRRPDVGMISLSHSLLQFLFWSKKQLRFEFKMYLIKQKNMAHINDATVIESLRRKGFNRRSCCCSLFRPSARPTSPYLTRTVHSTGQLTSVVFFPFVWNRARVFRGYRRSFTSGLLVRL